uniref:Ubiquitin carboxyl-terminal hydrolase 12-like n=1 Tax=Nicotiana tabacum TaxID=4097 RepID=A0A1S3ZM56_TOBAC|nr:PREDICTED: ubiquitin carboxyl-terminal hydrolase 12-like [Nicotiana tabacum]
MEKTGAIVSSHKVTVEIRDASPSHYLMKFESFYKLSENDIDMYESNEFEAWGYKWKLIIYPKGDDNIEGNDYISVYLAIANDSSLPAGWEANAVFSFFLFNQLCDNYLVIRDTYRLTFFYFTFVFFPFPFDRYRAFSGTSMFEIFPSELGRQVWRFHKVNCKWGFSKLISHKALKEQSNGYLVDDSIIIGAERRIKDLNSIGSVEPGTEGLNPPLIDDQRISIYLTSVDAEGFGCRKRVKAKYTLSVKDQINGEHHDEG